jgi:hypothetical protein
VISAFTLLDVLTDYAAQIQTHHVGELVTSLPRSRIREVPYSAPTAGI